MAVVAVRTPETEGYPFLDATHTVESLEELLPGPPRT